MPTANRRFRSLLWASAISLWSPWASADDPLPDLAGLVRSLEYESALNRIDELRAQPGTSPAVRLRALELAALAHLGLGDEGRAREMFERLLTLDPGHELSDRRPSPRIAEVFQGVREVVRREPRAGLVVSVVAPSRSGSRVEVSASPDGEHAIVRVVFRTELDGQSGEVAAGRGGPPWRAEIPVPERDAAARLEVTARGFAPSGRLAAVSRSIRPMLSVRGHDTVTEAHVDPTMPVGPSDAGGILGRWWFWTAVGAVVVGGTVTAFLLTNGGGAEPAQDGDLGNLTLH